MKKTNNNLENTIAQIKTRLVHIDDALDDDEKIRMVRSCWEIGRLVDEYRTATGEQINDIAKATGVHRALMQRYSQFYRSFPKGYPEMAHGRVVTWSNIVEVLPVRSARQRLFYLKEACRLGWGRHALKARIKEGYYTQQKNAGTESYKTLDQRDDRLYIYAAEVVKVVDGDTLDLEIDVGFRMKIEHRVRLRGIDCPEISTPKGKKAHAFVKKELDQCIIEKPLFKGRLTPRPLVLVKSYKMGVYGRYIVDVYYKPGEKDLRQIVEHGRLLNQVLLDEGLAKVA